MKYPIECICKNKDYKKIFSGYFNRLDAKDYYFEILKCTNCGLKKTYPSPDISNIMNGCNIAFMQNTEEWEKKDTWSAGIARLAKKYVSGGNFLDIGCFTGRLVEAAEHMGFNPYGVEVNKTAVEYAKEKDRNVYLGTVEEAGFKNNFFSCIVMNHVLEHLPNPINCIKEINRILQKDGILIIRVPAYDSIMRVIMRQNWMALMPHAHFFHYTKKTLNFIIISNSDLKIISMQQRGNTEPFANTSLKDRIKYLIVKFASFINKGDEIELIYRKI